MHAAVHLEEDVKPLGVDHLPELFNLGESGGNELLAAVPRVDGHEEDHVRFAQNHLQAGEGRGRVQDHGGFSPQLLDLLHQALQVPGRLHMHSQPIGPRIEVCFDIEIGVGDHEVHVQGEVRDLSHGPENRETDGQVGHEVAVHDVHMDPVHPGGFGGFDLFRQVPEVGGEDGGGEFFRFFSHVLIPESVVAVWLSRLGKAGTGLVP